MTVYALLHDTARFIARFPKVSHFLVLKELLRSYDMLQGILRRSHETLKKITVIFSSTPFYYLPIVKKN